METTLRDSAPRILPSSEDGIVEKTATFAEGNEPARSLRELAEGLACGTSGDLAKRSV